MGLAEDLESATDEILAKNDALIALIGDLVTAADASKNLPASVTAAIVKLKAESLKDDGVLHPTPAPTA